MRDISFLYEHVLDFYKPAKSHKTTLKAGDVNTWVSSVLDTKLFVKTFQTEAETLRSEQPTVMVTSDIVRLYTPFPFVSQCDHDIKQ